MDNNVISKAECKSALSWLWSKSAAPFWIAKCKASALCCRFQAPTLLAEPVKNSCSRHIQYGTSKQPESRYLKMTFHTVWNEVAFAFLFMVDSSNFEI